jgi:3-phenylpropionate/cinnamic acid dioxygenase small subunit
MTPPGELQHMLDRQAIVDLTIAYCWAIDSHDWDTLRSQVFTADAVAILGDERKGVEAIVTRITRALSPLDASQHLVTNHQVTISGDRSTATSRCGFQAQHVRADAPNVDTLGCNYIVAGTYADRVVNTPDGWRIAHRTLTTVWTSGNPAIIGR